MRVVAGVARGRPLRAPRGGGTRPTSDRVREALFSMLTSMDVIDGATVVDLFAGSGALGVEALSRGAAEVTFVDNDPAARDAINANLNVLGDLAGRARVLCVDALRYAETVPAVDLVLADPPYRFDRWEQLLRSLAGRAALVVAETSAESAAALEAGLSPRWETVKVRRYGGTLVTVAQPVVQLEGLVRQEGEI
jgi:16S rRNA (guanine966-N2)-methyltransferase